MRWHAQVIAFLTVALAMAMFGSGFTASPLPFGPAAAAAMQDTSGGLGVRGPLAQTDQPEPAAPAPDTKLCKREGVLPAGTQGVTFEVAGETLNGFSRTSVKVTVGSDPCSP